MIGKWMHRFPAALFASLTLASGMIYASGSTNAEQSAPAGGHEQHMTVPQEPTHDMPGMMGMEHGPGAEGMGGHDMSPVDVSEAPAAGPEAHGGQLLQPTLRDGVKELSSARASCVGPSCPISRLAPMPTTDRSQAR